MSIISRFLNVFRSKALEREFDDEVRFHLEERTADNRRCGMTAAEAESAAHQQFGDVARAKQGMQEARMMNRKVAGTFALGFTLGIVAMGLLGRAKPVPAAVALPTPEFYRVGQEGITMPVVLHEVKPKYTPDAMHAKITGTVVMECIVQPNGTCEDVHVTKPLDPGLDREAVSSLQAWRFQPGRRRGKPVPVVVTVEMAFTLRL